MIVNMPAITKKRHFFKLDMPEVLQKDEFGIWWLFSEEKATSVQHAELLRKKPGVWYIRQDGLEDEFKNIISVSTDVDEHGRYFVFCGEMR